MTLVVGRLRFSREGGIRIRSYGRLRRDMKVRVEGSRLLLESLGVEVGTTSTSTPEPCFDIDEMRRRNDLLRARFRRT